MLNLILLSILLLSASFISNDWFNNPYVNYLVQEYNINSNRNQTVYQALTSVYTEAADDQSLMPLIEKKMAKSKRILTFNESTIKLEDGPTVKVEKDLKHYYINDKKYPREEFSDWNSVKKNYLLHPKKFLIPFLVIASTIPSLDKKNRHSLTNDRKCRKKFYDYYETLLLSLRLYLQDQKGKSKNYEREAIIDQCRTLERNAGIDYLTDPEAPQKPTPYHNNTFHSFNALVALEDIEREKKDLFKVSIAEKQYLKKSYCEFMDSFIGVSKFKKELTDSPDSLFQVSLWECKSSVLVGNNLRGKKPNLGWGCIPRQVNIGICQEVSLINNCISSLSARKILPTDQKDIPKFVEQAEKIFSKECKLFKDGLYKMN